MPGFSASSVAHPTRVLPLSPSHPAGLIISLQLLRGDMEQVRRENPLIFSRGVAITRKLGFPDVIVPGERHLQPRVKQHNMWFISFSEERRREILGDNLNCRQTEMINESAHVNAAH